MKRSEVVTSYGNSILLINRMQISRCDNKRQRCRCFLTDGTDKQRLRMFFSFASDHQHSLANKVAHLHGADETEAETQP